MKTKNDDDHHDDHFDGDDEEEEDADKNEKDSDLYEVMPKKIGSGNHERRMHGHNKDGKK